MELLKQKSNPGELELALNAEINLPVDNSHTLISSLVIAAAIYFPVLSKSVCVILPLLPAIVLSSLPVAISFIFTNLSSPPDTSNFASGEIDNELIKSVCPVVRTTSGFWEKTDS